MDDQDDEWSEHDEGIVVTKCDRCGKVKPCHYAPDPFIAEVYPEDTPEPAHWCGPCWSERADDI